MSETSVTLTTRNKEHNATCAWCESPFVRKTANGLYCSDDCRSEVKESQRKAYHQRFYTYIKPNEPKRYQDYDEPDLQNSIYQVRPPEPRETVISMNPVSVPELNFKRYRERKNIITFVDKWEKRRDRWS